MNNNPESFESSNNQPEKEDKIIHAKAGERLIIEMEDAESKQTQVDALKNDTLDAYDSPTPVKDTVEHIKFSRNNTIEKIGDFEPATVSEPETVITRSTPVGDAIDSFKFNQAKAPIDSFTPSSQYYNIPKPKGLKRFIVGLGVFLGLAGAVKAEGGKNPTDSTDKAKNEQMIKEIESHREINDQIRKDWNDYISWLETQGLKGDPSLDHQGMGMKKLAEYIKTHPQTSLQATEEGVKQIQAEFIKYRRWVLDEIKAGRAKFSEGANEGNFMSWLSKYDGIPGQFTTRSQFPGSRQTTKEQTIYNDGTKRVEEKTTVKNTGYAKIGKDYSNQPNAVQYPTDDVAKNN